MSKAIAMMAGIALLAVCGCQKGVRGGGPAKSEGFSIDVPNFTQDFQQGEVKTVTIKLNRGQYFKQDVRLSVHEPQGIHIEPANITVKASEPANVPLRISVPRNAAVGQYVVRITGEPEQGAPASARFTVKVVAPKGTATSPS